MSANSARSMSRPNLPPTPHPSKDITSQGSTNAPSLKNTLKLPPAALDPFRGASSSSEASENASDSPYPTVSPTTVSRATITRKRPHASLQQGVITKMDYSLPPPPTRSRRIIQMRPKDEAQTAQNPVDGTKTGSNTAMGTNKRKQTGSTPAAGRKTARKTAHSLIERRRRFKMNEEFRILKDMIPACKGQEMHKLAILQASIEYMRYLNQCVDDLKNSHQSRLESPSSMTTEPARLSTLQDLSNNSEEDEEDEDGDMDDARPATCLELSSTTAQKLASLSPAICQSDISVRFPSTYTSPAIAPLNPRYSLPKASPNLQPSDPSRYTLTISTALSTTDTSQAQPSPIFKALTPSASQSSNPFDHQSHSVNSLIAAGSAQSLASFALTSPALRPQADREYQEATEALLMLNTDRRNWSIARGMSVRDLLA